MDAVLMRCIHLTRRLPLPSLAWLQFNMAVEKVRAWASPASRRMMRFHRPRWCEAVNPPASPQHHSTSFSHNVLICAEQTFSSDDARFVFHGVRA